MRRSTSFDGDDLPGVTIIPTTSRFKRPTVVSISVVVACLLITSLISEERGIVKTQKKAARFSTSSDLRVLDVNSSSLRQQTSLQRNAPYYEATTISAYQQESAPPAAAEEEQETLLSAGADDHLFEKLDDSNKTASDEQITDFGDLLTEFDDKDQIYAANKDNNASMAQNATFSACLLIKDDNALLNEWIAYHYHVLNMRILIVAVDPHSQQFPTELLKRWNNLTDIRIFEWNDHTYMPRQFRKTRKAPSEFQVPRDKFSFPQNITFNLTDQTLQIISNHRYRQVVFLTECMKRLKELHATWMIHIDTDEFALPSKELRLQEPNHEGLRPLVEPGSLLRLVQHVSQNSPRLVNYPCLAAPRLLFGSVETDSGNKTIPAPFDARKFETLRWLHHGDLRHISAMGLPKVLLDLSQVSLISSSNRRKGHELVFSIHRPFLNLCRSKNEIGLDDYNMQPVTANHYLGSWERYSNKQDDRRHRHVYDAKANQTFGKDDYLLDWLQGFVASVGGADKAKALLGDDYLLK